MRLIYLVLASVLLSGCGGEEFQDLRDFVANAGADMRGKIPPPPEVKPYEPFAYENADGLSDPFKPRKPVRPVSSAPVPGEPDKDRPKEALEEFPLEGLRMVGYLQQNKVGYAVVRAPDGKHHRVKVGNYIGMNFGLIKEISETEIVIQETVQDSTGDWSERMSSLQLIE